MPDADGASLDHPAWNSRLTLASRKSGCAVGSYEHRRRRHAAPTRGSESARLTILAAPSKRHGPSLRHAANAASSACRCVQSFLRRDGIVRRTRVRVGPWRRAAQSEEGRADDDAVWRVVAHHARLSRVSYGAVGLS